MAFVLSPSWRMRRDRGGVLLYKLDDLGNPDEYRFIHPWIAILMALLDGRRSEEDLSSIFGYIADLPKDDASTAVRNFIETHREYLIDISETDSSKIRRYDPIHFVMSPDEIDLSANKRLISPLSLLFLLTNDCPVDCRYCYAEKQRIGNAGKPLPLSRIREIVREASDLGIATIQFSGGDPFLHPNFLDILEEIVSRGICPGIIPTKSEISDETIQRLMDLGIDKIQISIDSVDPEIGDFLTRSPGFVSRMMGNIRRIRAHGMRFRVNAVITPYNVYGIPELVDALASFGVEDISLTPYGRSAYHHSDDLFLERKHLEWIDEVLPELKERHPEVRITYSGSSSPPPKGFGKAWAYQKRAGCTAGTRGLVVFPDGKVVTCEQLPSTPECVVGDLSYQSIKEVWDSERLMEFLIPPRERFKGWRCYDCIDFYECHSYLGRCVRDAFIAYGTVYAPSPRCPKAPKAPRLS